MKFQNPRPTQSGRKVRTKEERKEKQKISSLKFFCELKQHVKYQNPRKKREKESERREKTPSIVATTFCLQRPRAAHAISSDQ